MTTMTTSTRAGTKFEFAERALIDFDLLDAYYAREPEERDGFEHWLEGAESTRAEEERVSLLLDCLDAGLKLPPYGRPR